MRPVLEDSKLARIVGEVCRRIDDRLPERLAYQVKLPKLRPRI